MDKMFFLRYYGILLSAKSVLIDTDVAELTYQAYRDDFTDDEFAAVCMAVLRNENFYGRPPDPAIFAKYVKASAAETDFIAKCADYLRRIAVNFNQSVRALNACRANGEPVPENLLETMVQELAAFHQTRLKIDALLEAYYGKK